MKLRLLAAALALCCLLAAGRAAAAEDPVPRPGTIPATKAPPGWKVARTAWGDPDLTGMWPVDYLAGNPARAPAEPRHKARLTDEEYAAAQLQADERSGSTAWRSRRQPMGMGHWTEDGRRCGRPR